MRGGGLTLLLEGEVLCEVPALVVPSEEEEGAGVVDLQRPEEQNTLQSTSHTGGKSEVPLSPPGQPGRGPGPLKLPRQHVRHN